MKVIKFVSLISISLFLSACGGGGSSDSSNNSGGSTPPAPVSYTVTATAGAGGTISPSSRSVTSGQTTTFTVSANTGYEIDRVSGCGGSLSGDTFTTWAITSACSVESTFKKLNFTVSVTTSGSGTVSSTKVTVPFGETAEITALPDEEHGVFQAEGCDGIFDVGSNVYTTGEITQNCSVSIAFEGVLTGELLGPEIFLKDTDGAFELRTDREVETDWVVSTAEGGANDANIIITNVDEQNVTISSDLNGHYVASVTMNRGYLTAALEIPFKVATQLSENIEEDTLLLLSDSPFILTEDIFIRQEKILSAEPGVELYGQMTRDQFARTVRPNISVFGTLDFEGTSENRIYISDIDISGGDTHSTDLFYFIKFRNVSFTDGSFHESYRRHGYLDIRHSEFKGLTQSLTRHRVSIGIERSLKPSFFIGNRFINSGIRLLSFGSIGGKITIENNLFINPLGSFLTEYAISIHGDRNSLQLIDVQHNSFYTDDKVAVRLYSRGAVDAPNNYWGTTDEEEIKKMIWDMNDDPALLHAIEFRPFLTEPHPDTPVYSGDD